MGGCSRAALLTLLLVAALSDGFAQHQVTRVGRSQLPAVDGLHYLSQDTSGRYWMMAARGLIRFDGSRGALFPVQDPDNDRTLNEYPQSPPLAGPDGRLWLTTYRALHVFDPVTERFRSVQLEDERGRTVDAYYYLLEIDAAGNAMLRAGDYLWHYDTTTGRYRKVGGPTAATSLVRLAPDVWVGVGYTDTLEVFRIPPGGSIYSLDYHPLPVRALCVLRRTNASAWVGTDEGLGVIELPEAGTPLVYRQEVADRGVKIVLLDRQDKLWYTAKNDGIRRYDPVAGRVIASLGPKDGLSSSDPSYLFLDRDDRIWAAQYGHGYDVITPQRKLFHTVLRTADAPVADLHTPDGSTILVGDQHGLIRKLTTTARSPLRLHDLPSQHEGANRSRKLQFDGGGAELWAGSQQQLGLYDPRRGDFTWYDRPAEPITDFYRSGSGLLVVLSPQGVMSVRPEADSIRVEPLLPFAPSDQIRYTGLFGITDSTFLVWDEGTDILPCKVRDGAVVIEGRLRANSYVITALQWDDQVYLGTDAGLQLIRNDSIIPVLTTDDRGRQLRVSSMIADQDGGCLFLGTDKGLLRYHPATDSLNRYGITEGLPSEVFLPADPVRLDDGTIWMATDSAIVCFHPDSLLVPTTGLRPYVSGLWINDIARPEELTGGQLTALERGYQQNSLVLRLGLIGMLPEQEGMIEYQLEDYDLTPVRVARNGSVRYPRLPPGEYTLRLTAIDGRGQPSGSSTIPITVNPPFWDTVWFRVAAVLTLLLIALGVYTYLLRRERQKQLRLHEQQAMINAERDRIAGEVHDDLGGQLSSIMFLSEELLLTEAAPELEQELGRINELSQHSLHNIRDIIFALDNRRATLADLCEQIRAAGDEFFRDHRIAFSFDGECVAGERPVNSRQKRNLFSAVREAWHNVVKHAEASLVTMRFQATDHHLRIVVTDDGKGMPGGEVSGGTGGYGVENMHAKVTAIGGKLDVASQPAAGTTLTFSIPLTETTEP